MRSRCGLKLRVTLRPKSLAICGRGWKATKILSSLVVFFKVSLFLVSAVPLVFLSLSWFFFVMSSASARELKRLDSHLNWPIPLHKKSE